MLGSDHNQVVYEGNYIPHYPQATGSLHSSSTFPLYNKKRVRVVIGNKRERNTAFTMSNDLVPRGDGDCFYP